MTATDDLVIDFGKYLPPDLREEMRALRAEAGDFERRFHDLAVRAWRAQRELQVSVFFAQDTLPKAFHYVAHEYFSHAIGWDDLFEVFTRILGDCNAVTDEFTVGMPAWVEAEDTKFTEELMGESFVERDEPTWEETLEAAKAQARAAAREAGDGE